MTLTGMRSHRDEPLYWFARLEIARNKGDRDAAGEARRQLKRLGVRVKYLPPNREAVR